MIKNFFERKNIEYIENCSLKNYNTYKIDSKCAYLVFPNNKQELIDILEELKKNKINYYILGNGSNIILKKDYYDAVFIKLNKLNKIIYNNNLVTASCGVSLAKLALETIEKGLSGMEFAAGIPGNVGASTAMNAGAYNSDMSKIVKSIEVLKSNNEIITLTNKELEYKYRSSILKDNKDMIVLSTTFELSNGNIEEMKKIVDERRKKRISTQPLSEPNAGSVFRNPDNMYAGELIEKSNLKGYNLNGAEVSLKHANFIVNNGNAKGKDIVELINIIQKKVKENYGVDLKLEQIIFE